MARRQLDLFLRMTLFLLDYLWNNKTYSKDGGRLVPVGLDRKNQGDAALDSRKFTLSAFSSQRPHSVLVGTRSLMRPHCRDSNVPASVSARCHAGRQGCTESYESRRVKTPCYRIPGLASRGASFHLAPELGLQRGAFRPHAKTPTPETSARKKGSTCPPQTKLTESIAMSSGIHRGSRGTAPPAAASCVPFPGTA